MSTRQRTSTPLILSAALLLTPLVAGCTSVRVTPPAPAVPKTLIVFPFEDAKTGVVRDHTFLGTTGSDQAGEIVADIIRTTFKERPEFKVVSRSRTHAALEQAGMKRAPLDSPRKRLSMARKLGADAAVLGRVTSFKQSWFLFLAWSRVRWEARVVDAKTGKVLCRAKARSLRPYALEDDAVHKQAQELVKRVRAGR